MFLTSLIALGLALQGAAQNPPSQNPNQAQPPINTAPQNAPPVSASIPGKYIAPAPASGSAVAKVNGQPIYGHDVESLLWEVFGPQPVEDIINLVMVRQAAAKQDIHVQQADVEKRLKEDIKLYDDQSKGDQRRPAGMPVEAFLLQAGFPISRLYLDTEIEVLLDRMAEKTFKSDSFFKFSLMLFKPDAPTAAAAAVALQNAQAAVARIRAGTSKWEAEIAKSQMPAEFISKAGALGWHDQSDFPADVIVKIKTLAVGQISDPIKTDVRGTPTYQVYRMEQPGSTAVGTDLETLKTAYLHAQHKPLLDAIKIAAKIERFPTTEPAGTAPTVPPTSPPKSSP